ncbi:MAG: FUSC family membrane protein [Bacteroidota bacterium]
MISPQLHSAFRFFRSHDFLRAVAMTALMVIAGCVLYFLGYEDWITGTCIGILIVSFNDIQGSAVYRTWALVLSSLLSGFIVFLVNLLYFSLPLTLLFIAIVSFLLYMLSVFGKRAEVFAFAGGLSIVLSLVKVYEGVALIEYAFTIIAGGFLYTFVSSVYHFFTRKRQIKEQLGELAKLTSDYLEHRIFLAKQSNFRKEVNNRLLDLQVAIIEKQEKLRTLILSDRKIRFASSTRNKQMFLLIELIDFMELAVANPANLAKIKSLSNVTDDMFQPFLELAEKVSNRVICIAQELRSFNINPVKRATIDFTEAENTIQQFLDQIGLPEAREGVLLMSNLLDYYKLQLKRLSTMESMLGDTMVHEKLALTESQQTYFLQKEKYHFKEIPKNFRWQSPVFRQALRMSFALILGYVVGALLHVERIYWIMLTILLILRLSYGMTLQRSVKRVIGTAIGAALALLFIQLSTSIAFFVVLAALGMIFSFSLLERNYTIASFAITISVIFAFALLDPNLYTVIQFRFIDTVLGAVVSMAVAYVVFPLWEFRSFQKSIAKAMNANRLFLREILHFHLSDPKDDTDYRLKRKAAFLESSHLNANFQRYKRDPKSKQRNYELFYELVKENHALVSTLTSLGNYLKERNIPKLNLILKNVWTALDTAFDSILQKEASQKLDTTAFIQLNAYWQRLEYKRNREYESGKKVIDPAFKQELQEVQMIQQEVGRIWELLESVRGLTTDCLKN